MALAISPAPPPHHSLPGTTPMYPRAAESSYFTPLPERQVPMARRTSKPTRVPLSAHQGATVREPSDSHRTALPTKSTANTSPSRRVRSLPISKRSGIASLTSNSTAFSRLLSFLPWTDFLSLSQTCRATRMIMKDHDLKDVVLSRYVEGYGMCLKMHVGLRQSTQEVPVSLHDIDLLLISQHTPLHHYPTRALSSLSSLLPQVLDQRSTQKLVQLSQAHSRFVLILQSLAHSSSLASPAEPGPDIDPYVEDNAQGLPLATTLPRARSTISGLSTSSSMRELTFPAPLSRPKSAPLNQDVPPPIPDKLHHHSTLANRPARSSPNKASFLRSSSVNPTTSPNAKAKQANILQTNQSVRAPPSNSHVSGKAVKRRTSIFGGSTVAPPPPSEPKDLKVFSSSWRRSLINASISHNKKRIASESAHTVSATEGWTSDDEQGFLRPQRRFTSDNFNVSDSSFTSFSGSGYLSAGTSSPRVTQSERRSSLSPPPSPTSPLASPHELMLATSRVRAPVLRVYVPCSDLSEAPDFLDVDYVHAMGGISSIQRCEEQLAEAGLWEHLSTGDIVCNLGYVPPAGSNSGTEDGGEDSIPGPSRETSRVRGRSRGTGNETRKWLIFNGSYLVPFSPTTDRLPVDDAITLPSPFYYDHIMSLPLEGMSPRSRASFGSVMGLKGGNLRMMLGPFPAAGDQEPQTQLVSSVANVRSPHSKGGVATVRQWAWTARVWRSGVSLDAAGAFSSNVDGAALTMGLGWEGEWTLEGDGTMEGRQFLIDCLAGSVKEPLEWEFVRAKSGGGRIWLKLLDSGRSRDASKHIHLQSLT